VKSGEEQMLASGRRGTGHRMGHIVRTFGLDQLAVRRRMRITP
jgi:hypothetical protein